MATYDQEYRLGVRVDSSSVDPATAKLRALKQEMKEVESSTSFSGRSARMTELTKEINAAERSMAKFKTTATQVGQAGQAIHHGAGRGAQGMLTLANSVQDFQAAGLRGVLNNIPMLVTALGGGAGLAGGVMIAGVAFEVASKQIDMFTKAIADNFDEVGAGQKQFNKLAEDAKGATDAMFEQSDVAKQSQSDIINTIRNTPGGAAGIASKIVSKMEAGAGLGGFAPQEGAFAIKEAEAGGNERLIEMTKRAVANSARQEAQKYYENRLRILAADPTRTEELEREIARADPEAAAKVAAVAKPQMTVGTPEMAAAAQRAYAKKQNDLVDDLNKQGQENEKLGKAIAERTEAELRAKEAVERHTRTERQAQLVKESGGGPIPFLAEQIAGMTLGKQYGGQGLEIGEALDVTRQRIAQQAMYSRINGGLGMNAESAMAFATQQVNAAYGDAANMAAMQKQMFPEAGELAKQQKEANGIYKDMLTRGVPIRVRKVGTR